MNQSVTWSIVIMIAYETYVKYSAYHPEDAKIAEIANDELEHARELKLAMSMIT